MSRTDAPQRYYTTNRHVLLWLVLGLAVGGVGIWRMATDGGVYSVAMGLMFLTYGLRMRLAAVFTLRADEIEMRPGLLGKKRRARYAEVSALTVRQNGSAELETDANGKTTIVPLPLHLLAHQDAAALIDDLGRRCQAHRTAAANAATRSDA